MEPFPVIRVYRPFLDREIVFHCAMIDAPLLRPRWRPTSRSPETE
jgi:hypothetical protein